MAKQRIVIELSPTRLGAALVRGREVADRKSERLNLPTYAEAWPGVLDSIQDRLKALVEELGAADSEAVLLYSSPTAVTGVFSCAQGAGAAQAGRAVRPALAEAASFPLAANPHSLQRLTTDERGSADGSAPASIHTLGVADTEATAKALAAWLTSAGLEPVVLVPDEAPAIASAVDAALSLASGDAVQVVLYVGEHRSALAAASQGRLRFIRQIAIGTESLIQAWTRELSIEGKPVTLDHAWAAEALSRVGIPDRKLIVDVERGVTGDALLPLVQPILQRCVVDIKQSLRFGLEEKERENVTVHGIGPGAGIPSLMRLIGMQSGMKAGAQAAQAGASAPATIDTWLEGRELGVNLLPQGVKTRMAGRRMRRGMWVGVGAAMTLIVADGLMTRMELSSQLKQCENLQRRVDGAAPATTLLEKLTGLQSGLSAARQRISAKLDAVADWDAAMVMLAKCTPDSIKLTQVTFQFDGGHPVCRLSGHAPIAGKDASAMLQTFMDSMSATPVVRACRLVAAQRSESAGVPVQNFDMTVTLLDLPAPAQSPDAITNAEKAAKEETP